MMLPLGIEHPEIESGLWSGSGPGVTNCTGKSDITALKIVCTGGRLLMIHSHITDIQFIDLGSSGGTLTGVRSGASPVISLPTPFLFGESIFSTAYVSSFATLCNDNSKCGLSMYRSAALESSALRDHSLHTIH